MYENELKKKGKLCNRILDWEMERKLGYSNIIRSVVEWTWQKNVNEEWRKQIKENGDIAMKFLG